MTANSEIKTPLSSKVYRPSVPISVYRELVEELEATQIDLEELEVENQHLSDENQQLRAEMTKVVRYAKHLEQVVRSFEDSVNDTLPNHPLQGFDRELISSFSSSTPPSVKKPAPAKVDKKQVAEIKLPQSLANSEESGQINGWLLAIAILLIVMTSCVGAFWLVSARLSQNPR